MHSNDEMLLSSESIYSSHMYEKVKLFVSWTKSETFKTCSSEIVLKDFAGNILGLIGRSNKRFRKKLKKIEKKIASPSPTEFLECRPVPVPIWPTKTHITLQRYTIYKRFKRKWHIWLRCITPNIKHRSNKYIFGWSLRVLDLVKLVCVMLCKIKEDGAIKSNKITTLTSMDLW